MTGPPAANARPCKIRAKSAWACVFVKNAGPSSRSRRLARRQEGLGQPPTDALRASRKLFSPTAPAQAAVGK